MSCSSDFIYGDVGVPIVIDIDGCNAPLDDTIASARFIFSGPCVTTFTREAIVTDDLQASYATTATDYAPDAFNAPGMWSVAVVVVTVGGAELESIDCAAFVIGSSKRRG